MEEEAFGLYVPMLTQWRRLPYRDPGIPLSLLPPDWNGVTAAALFGELHDTLSAPGPIGTGSLRGRGVRGSVSCVR